MRMRTSKRHPPVLGFPAFLPPAPPPPACIQQRCMQVITVPVERVMPDVTGLDPEGRDRPGEHADWDAVLRNTLGPIQAEFPKGPVKGRR